MTGEWKSCWREKVLKVAIIHDWLVTKAGAELVLEQLLVCFPNADVFTLVDFLPESERGFLQNHKVTTSFIQRLPGAHAHFRYYLPLMARALSSFDLGGYDLVISSSWAFARRVRLKPGQCHVSYIHTPIRYVWDQQERYLQEGLSNSLARLVARVVLANLRRSDVADKALGGRLIANSSFIKARIEHCWQQPSVVLNPPVPQDDLGFGDEKDDFYICVSRLVPYKGVELLVEAFNRMPERKLVLVGAGPLEARIRSVAGENIEVLGFLDRPSLVGYLRRARAFVFAGLEDFGIAMVEAQACGTPVIAYGQGGIRDSVIPFDGGAGNGANPAATGLWFEEQSAESIMDAVKQFESLHPEISSLACRDNARRFDPSIFRQEFMQIVEDAYGSRIA